jgi:hypothetical protein
MQSMLFVMKNISFSATEWSAFARATRKSYCNID